MPQETGFADSAARAIEAAVVVPVIRTPTARDALAVAEWAIAQDLPAIELTATIPDWRKALQALRRSSPETVVGVGTLRTAEVARAACDDGAGFLVSPVPAPAVAQVGAEHGVLVIGGGFTPAELFAAATNGIAKLFPAHARRSALPALRARRRAPRRPRRADWRDRPRRCRGVARRRRLRRRSRQRLAPGPESAARLRELRAVAA